MNKRKTISKGLRFSVFCRDNYTCRYCGRQSDAVPLEIDHVLPVCQGGTNDIENLVTACGDCNRGKSGNTIQQVAPNETDRLRLAQERNEQVKAAESVRQAVLAREELLDAVTNYWCSCTGRTSADRQTILVMVAYVQRFGFEKVFEWILIASCRCPYSDTQMGRYVSGCRNQELADDN